MLCYTQTNGLRYITWRGVAAYFGLGVWRCLLQNKRRKFPALFLYHWHYGGTMPIIIFFMQKTVIAVMAPSNHGKSNSLNYLIDILFSNKDIEVDEKINFKDRLVIGTYRETKVGIITHGDPHTGIENQMKRCIEQGCLIICAACRSKGRTIREIDEPAKKNNIQSVWISPYFSYWGESCGNLFLNEIFAENIIHFINRLINDK